MLTPEVLAHTQDRATELGVGLSEYIADVLAVATGRPDLARHVAVSDLPDVWLAAVTGYNHSTPRQRVTTRLAEPVAAVVRQHGMPAGRCVADVLARAMQRPVIGDQAPDRAAPRPIQEALLAI